jgi:hypothetical protein
MTNTYNYREKKIVAVLDKTLDAGTALNVLGHMAIRLGVSYGNGMMGRETLYDASGTAHPGIAKYPLIITAVKQSTVRKAVKLARGNDAIALVDYPQQMLETGHDDELTEAMGREEEDRLTYLGAVLYGDTDAVNDITGKYSLWKP